MDRFTRHCTSSSNRVGSAPSGSLARITGARSSIRLPGWASRIWKRKLPIGAGYPSLFDMSWRWRRPDMWTQRWFYTLPLRLRPLFQRRQVEHELEEEFQFHVERKTEQYIAQGLNPEEARRRQARHGRARTAQRGVPEHASSEFHRQLDAGPSLRPAHDAPQPRGYRRGGPLAGFGHRRKYRDLQPDRRSDAQNAAREAPGTTGLLVFITWKGKEFPALSQEFVGAAD